MKIYIPSSHLQERTYIIDIIFEEFLGVTCKLIPKPAQKYYEIVLENGNKLIIKDCFFKNFSNELDYLRRENVPEKIQSTTNQFLVEKDIPIIFGNDELVVSEDKIICNIDIFASAFFMLTRWEEYVNKIRDKHNRFPASESVAYKNGFLDRPVVNEYVEMLWNMLSKLGIKQKRKERRYDLLLTHDVDIFYKYRSLKSGIKEIGGDILKRGRFVVGAQKAKEKLLVHCGIRKDLFDTFDYLMNIAERVGVRCHFFLMSGGTSEYDNYQRISNNVVSRIISRGHEIGFHSSYYAYNDKARFIEERSKVERSTGISVISGRQHFLRFEIPTTWQVWEDNDMEWDSTLGYADKEGFRCGACYEYSVFNFLTREKLKLKEKPLIVMDGSFVNYQPEITPMEMELKIQALVDKCCKYNGTFVFLWHNSSFGTSVWKPYEKVYENVVLRNTGGVIL